MPCSREFALELNKGACDAPQLDNYKTQYSPFSTMLNGELFIYGYFLLILGREAILIFFGVTVPAIKNNLHNGIIQHHQYEYTKSYEAYCYQRFFASC